VVIVAVIDYRKLWKTIESAGKFWTEVSRKPQKVIEGHKKSQKMMESCNNF
jgi:ribosomal protein S2